MFVVEEILVAGGGRAAADGGGVDGVCWGDLWWWRWWFWEGRWGSGLGRGGSQLGGMGSGDVAVVGWWYGWFVCGGGRKRASPEGTDSPVMFLLRDRLFVAFSFFIICFFFNTS